MKYVRILFAVALVFMVCSAFSFKKGKEGKEKAVYAFGVAASFNDTVVIKVVSCPNVIFIRIS